MNDYNMYLKPIVRMAITLFAINCLISHAKAGGPEVCEPQIKIVEKIVYVEKIQEIPIEIEIPRDITRKNRLSLLVLNGPSNSVSVDATPTSTTIKHEDKNALGGQYMRDLGRFNVLIQGDTNRNVGLGVGINW